jgi:hypothetical protein
MVEFVLKSLKLFFVLIIIQFVIVISFLIVLNKINARSFILTKNQMNSDGMVYMLGNSHPECAINDSLLCRNYVNVAQSGEPLFYSVIKARRLLSNNCKIDTMIIEFTNNSLNTVKWVISDSSLMRNYKKNFAIMNAKEHLFLFKNNPHKSLKTFFSMTPREIYLSRKTIDGRYLFLIRNKITGSDIKLNKSYFFEKVKGTDQSGMNEIQGFVNLLSLIKDHPTTFFVLTRMPMHKSYSGLGNEIQFQNCIKQLNKNKNCRFIDFLKSNLNDTDFGDAEHLNHYGARKFTPVFRDSVRSISSQKKF